ncbi:hypothetical protein GY45DRAFT_958965 [Cubamyces sp. BRFM 1775]|nr:hypothetical protein GY45DRAFT_958965 [Cubamyces sp. BRFM 1775]
MSSPQQPDSQASAPFNIPTVGLILRTSDNVAFHVRAGILAESSPVFYDMFALSTQISTDESHGAKGASDTSPSSPTSSSPAAVPEVPENSNTLDALLRICYPISNPTFCDLDVMKPVLAAAHKYQMGFVLETLGIRLVELARDVPLRVYAIAIRYDMDDVARTAARQFLRHDWNPAGGHPAELDDISGSAYHRLLAYRRKCADALASMCTGLGWLPNTGWTFMQCDSCPPGAPAPYCWLRDCEVGRKPAGWFWQYYQGLAARLQNTPCEDALDDVLLVTEPVKKARDCSTCGTKAFEQMLRFMLKMKEEVGRTVSEITLEIR